MTSTTRNTTAKPAKKTAAKRTTARKPAARKRTTKTTVDLRKPLPTRDTTPNPTGIAPSELAEIRAALAATAAGIRVPVLAWTATTNHSARYDTPTGAHLIHNPAHHPPITAYTPCRRGAHHTQPVHGPADLHTANRDAATCTTDHGTSVWPDLVYLPRTVYALGAAPTRNDNTQTIRLRLPADTEQPKEHAA